MYRAIKKGAIGHERHRAPALCAADELSRPAHEADIIVREDADLPFVERGATAQLFEILEERVREREAAVCALTGPGRVAEDTDDVGLNRESERFEGIF